MRMKSAWETDGMKKFKHLERDAEADICIVGGGIAGIWCAYLLSKEGKKVVVLEKDRLGRSETLYTTAFITQVIDTDLKDLVSMFGEKKAGLSWLSGKEAIDEIESVVEKEKIDCDFKRVSLHSYARSERELKILEEEVIAARKLGLEAGMVGPVPGFKNLGAMEIPGQAKYHPMEFLKGLIELSEKNGVIFHEETEAVEVSGRSAIHVLTKRGASVKAEDLIVATYEPFNNPKETHLKKGMYTSYVYALELLSDSMPEMMCEDLHNPYHYFRVDEEESGKKTMIVGGEDHREELKFMEKRSFRALKEYIEETFPDLEYRISHKWSGRILESSDGLPLIGKYADHEYIAAAFSGNGMTYAPIAGMLIRDLIMDKVNTYEDLYDPKRKILGKPAIYKFRDYTGEFFGGAVKNLFK